MPTLTANPVSTFTQSLGDIPPERSFRTFRHHARGPRPFDQSRWRQRSGIDSGRKRYWQRHHCPDGAWTLPVENGAVRESELSARFRGRCWRANCSDMRRAHLPEPMGQSRAASRWHIAVHCSWMKFLSWMLALQSKLLQLLQDGQFCRIGAQEDKKVEVRVVCATNRKLEKKCKTELFVRICFTASMS